MPTWAEICADPVLKDLPYKIETNRFGKIMMSPASFWRGGVEAETAHLLKKEMSGGRAMTECAMDTRDGVRVADVAWISRERKALNLPVAPEICVEILSPSNTREEMLGKMQLYFGAGAQEVWLCDEEGHMEFFACDLSGPMPRSKLCAVFPLQVELD